MRPAPHCGMGGAAPNEKGLGGCARSFGVLFFSFSVLTLLSILRNGVLLGSSSLVAPQRNAAQSLMKIMKGPRGFAPKWCQQLIRNPRPRDSSSVEMNCGRGRLDVSCEDGRPRFFSKHLQDVYTWNGHWKHLHRSGVYVDINAKNPVDTSNTYFYDTCLGWKGLCVQPDPNYWQLLKSYRSCWIEPTCLSYSAQDVQIAVRAGRSDIQQTVRGNATIPSNKIKQVRVAQRDMTCKKTAQSLADFGYRKIDMLSLNASGNDLNILRGIHWNATTISMILTNDNDDVAEFLATQGYYKHAVAGDDRSRVLHNNAIFLRGNVRWGSPH